MIFFPIFSFDAHIIKMLILPTLRSTCNNLRHRVPNTTGSRSKRIAGVEDTVEHHSPCFQRKEEFAFVSMKGTGKIFCRKREQKSHINIQGLNTVYALFPSYNYRIQESFRLQKLYGQGDICHSFKSFIKLLWNGFFHT